MFDMLEEFGRLDKDHVQMLLVAFLAVCGAVVSVVAIIITTGASNARGTSSTNSSTTLSLAAWPSMTSNGS
jgi:hypothetical protein